MKNSIKSNKTWKKKTKEEYYQRVKSKVEERNGVLLSNKYDTSLTKMKIKCSEGHLFEQIPQRLLYQNSWCPQCVKFISEELCRSILEHIYNKEFNKIRFKYMGRIIELDGYNKELNIAFEYNGAQHYVLNAFTKSEDELKERLYLDNLKKEYCKNNGINLLVIPYTIKNNDIPNYISNLLNINNINFNIKEFIKNYNRLNNKKEKALKIINEKCGELVDYDFNLITIKCNEGHQWTTNYYTIRNGHWCQKCAAENKKLSDEEIISRLENNNINIIDLKNEIFECDNKHLIDKTTKQILDIIASNKSEKNTNRRICNNCKKNRADLLFNRFKTYNYTCLNEGEYKNRNTVLNWLLPDGSKKLTTAKNIDAYIRRLL